ncbi:MAG: hypothetical protein CEO12_352 [Parcubacteria group bacterium Gr01-1014_46]|nr:MAG: hypothetical protein CEO12_352 [Parcubacteria group bacterium Gr01-1014_46]
MATNRNTSEKVIYPQLSYVITGILFSVHNELGQFAREKQYCDLIETKLKESNVKYKRELRIGNNGNTLDFLIENKIVLETKSTRRLVEDHFRQIQNYLQQTLLDLGILVNFRYKYIKPIRIIRIHS